MSEALPPLLKAGDIVLYRGAAWFSKAIRWCTADPKTGEPARVNHCGLIVWNGVGLNAWVVEALSSVKRHKLRESVAPGTTILVFRPTSLSDDDVERIVQYASMRINQGYDWWKIALFLVDSLLAKVVKRPVYFARRLFGSRRLICSSIVAEAYLSCGLAFGVESLSASPQDIYDFCIRNEGRYELVWSLTVEKT